jgi:uncharacterized protein (TIGR02284 family)
MVTMIGTENELVDLFNHLIELDFDAIAAYDEAITHLKKKEYQDELKRFRQDHYRHTQELAEIVSELGEEPAKKASLKSWLTKGKVVLAELGDDISILKAMLSNEEDTNTAYRKAFERTRESLGFEAFIKRAYEDEKRHKAWIEGILRQNA